MSKPKEPGGRPAARPGSGAPERRSMLDEAWTLVLSGKRDEGLRRAIALLEADALQLGAALLVTELLVAEQRSDVVSAVAPHLVEALVRRSDLPGATAAAALATRARPENRALYKTIAKSFGKGSPRLADVSPAPPPLPATPDIEPELAKLSSPALLERASKALAALQDADDPLPEGKLSQLPLFSDLAPPALEQLLAGFELRDLAPDAVAIQQGDEGREAFVVVRGALRAERRGSADDAEPGVLAVLGPGAIFGEMALVSEAPRAASVIAIEPVQLLVASREALEKIAQKEPVIGKQLSDFCRNRMMMNLVRHSSILNAVAPENRDELMARFETKTFTAGDVILAQGEETTGLFLIASGQVRVTGTDADGDSIVLAELGPGDVVGEISLVLRRPATATVTASHPTIALHLPRKLFQEAIRANPTLLAELYDLATKREEETNSVVAQQALDVEDIVLV